MALNGAKKLLKIIREAGDVAQKENSGGPKFVRTDKNIRLVEEMILSQEDQSGTRFTPSKTARELNNDLRSVSV